MYGNQYPCQKLIQTFKVHKANESEMGQKYIWLPSKSFWKGVTSHSRKLELHLFSKSY